MYDHSDCYQWCALHCHTNKELNTNIIEQNWTKIEKYFDFIDLSFNRGCSLRLSIHHLGEQIVKILYLTCVVARKDGKWKCMSWYISKKVESYVQKVADSSSLSSLVRWKWKKNKCPEIGLYIKCDHCVPRGYTYTHSQVTLTQSSRPAFLQFRQFIMRPFIYLVIQSFTVEFNKCVAVSCTVFSLSFFF